MFPTHSTTCSTVLCKAERERREKVTMITLMLAKCSLIHRKGKYSVLGNFPFIPYSSVQ